MQARRALTFRKVQKILERYGEQLACVRYRYDEQRRKRFTTVEIIVEESRPSCSVVSNRRAADGIPQNEFGKFTMTRWWRLVSRSG